MKSFLYFLVAVSFSVSAEVTTDGSLGAVKTFSGQFQIPQNIGTTVGNNLFHSFQQFNVQTGESATFTGSDSLKNVISRVTGGNPSIINGLLRSTIGQANFYFINPAGVTFGANAQVDVPAAFHVSTADNLKFADGKSFAASLAASSVLSIAEPTSFGFLGKQVADIQIQGSQLTFNGNQVSLSAGDILLDGGSITNPAGEVQIYAVGITPANITLSAPSDNLLNGKVNLENNSSVSVSGNGAGRLFVRAGDIKLTDSGLYASNKGDSHAGVTTGIDILNNTLSLDNSVIYANSLALGNATNIAIKSNQLAISNGGQISSSVYSQGNGGNLFIEARNITIDGKGVNGIINTNSGSGNPGIISVKSDNLSILNGGEIGSYAFSDGNAGEISIKSDSVSVSNNGNIRSSTTAMGNAGTISVSGNKVSVSTGGTIGTDTLGSGHAGMINMDANEIVVDGQDKPAFISSGTGNAGNAGIINIKSNRLSVLNDGQISTSTLGAGNAGIVTIKSDSVSVSNNGSINSGSDASGTGNSGAVNIEATGYVDVINNGAIETTTLGTANAGSVTVKSDSLTVLNKGLIGSDTSGSGNAGNVVIEAAKILIDGQGNRASITSNTGNKTIANPGHAGMVNIKADSLSLLNGGLIGSDTGNSANAGSITIEASHLIVDGKGYIAGISGNTTNKIIPNAGNAGTINIKSDSLSVLNSGLITSSTSGTGNAGNVSITSNNLSVLNGGTITTSTLGLGNAGNIGITITGNANLENYAAIDTTAYGTGKAGDISITTHDLSVAQSSYINSENTDGKGGKINLNTYNINLITGGMISTSTVGSGNAGDITVKNTGNILINGVDNQIFPFPNIGQVTGQFSGFYLNTLGLGNGGSLNLDTYNLTISDGAFISAVAAYNPINSDNTVSGDIHINANTVNLNGGGLISTTTSSAASAGSITLNATQSIGIKGMFDRSLHPDITNLRASDHSAILSNASYALNPNATRLGAGGNVTVNTPNLILSEKGLMSTATEGDKKAGNINVYADNLSITDNAKISAEATENSSGQTGSIIVAATQAIDLYNNAKITLQNDATVADPKAIVPTTVTVTAPLINLKNSQITTASTGNVNASNIAINFSDKLLLDPSYITTTANTGNGGTIDINGGKVIYLQDSGFKTSVAGQNSNGGNINVTADVLAMNTGVIQANAVGGVGGDINLKLQDLIPSYNSLIKGGKSVTWESGIPGFNVIQAASETGVSGTLTITAPQFDISGSLSGLDGAGLLLPRIEPDTCTGSISQVSSLARGGKGGVPLTEAKSAFIPPAKNIPFKSNGYSVIPTVNFATGCATP